MNLCQYKDALGVPGQGVHAPRIGTAEFNVAAFDVLGTVVGAAALAHYADIGFLCALAILMTLAIALHWAFCVDTALNVALFRRNEAFTH